mgnify:CR=1 FL=1
MIFEYEVLAVGPSGDVSRLDIEDFLDVEATVAHQSDYDFTFKHGRHSREDLELRAREPDVPGAVFVLLRSHCVSLSSIMQLNPVFRGETGGITGIERTDIA